LNGAAQACTVIEKLANEKRSIVNKSGTQRLRASQACDNNFVLPQRGEFALRADKSARRQAGCHFANQKPLFCKVIRSAKLTAW